jgi:ribosomal-protein-alanine N-acetyltransferase
VIAPDPDLSGDLDFNVGPWRLSPLKSADAPDVLGEFSDPEVTRYLDIDPLSDLAEAEAIITWAENQRSLGAGVRWAIRGPTGGFVGTCGFNRIVLERGRRGEVAYDLCAGWQGRGIMSEVLPAVMSFGWRILQLHRLEALVTPGNQRSCTLLERCGFTREGLLRGYGYWRGEYQDQIIYGRTNPTTIRAAE